MKPEVRFVTPFYCEETPEFLAWVGMISRCADKRDSVWKNYGGRGIKVCDEWINDYWAFLAHVGRKPSHKHSLDRYPNNDGNYEPGNVRWATLKEQSRNKRVNLLITFNGKTQCLQDWADELGINRYTIRDRYLQGLPIDQSSKKTEVRWNVIDVKPIRQNMKSSKKTARGQR